MAETERDAAATIRAIADGVERHFQAGRRVLSFSEFLELFETDPVRYSRDSSRYLRDVFDHYGTEKVVHPWGEFTRWKLFDLPWEEGGTKGALIGQEQVQEEIYRSLSNFAREGKPNRLVLLHGPNGSAKSTIVGCLMSALESYSMLDEGALYRFNWVFPSTKTVRGALGFAQAGGGVGAQGKGAASYAKLPDDQIDAKLLVEVRDHPLFLIPVPDRRRLLEAAYARAQQQAKDGQSVEPPSEWMLRGQLSHKSQQVFEALLSSYGGSYTEVLKHVQVERYFISRRYRVGAVTVGPQLSVDAAERQITADRSLAALPASLQAITLYEAKGELVEAAGGLLEFSDLLKRPLDAFKYLQLTVETGEVALTMQNVQLNCVMMGSANELHLDAFREHAEFASFRGRLELIRTPYLKSYVQEKRIYDTHVAPQVRRHVAPHATLMAAQFAVLTRMRKPNPDRFARQMSQAVSNLTAVEKAELYATGRTPDRLDSDTAKVLRNNVGDLYTESESYPIYEGRVGASPREMRIAILDAAQSTKFKCLSPLAVLEEIDALCQRKNEFEWLQQDPMVGSYHDVKAFRETLAQSLLELWEEEMYRASGLVEDQRYADLFDRYVQQVSVWVKKERLYDRVTRQYVEPDEKMMQEVERLLDVKGDPQDWRKNTISSIAAWALDHPNEKVNPVTVFPQHIRRMREAIFGQKRQEVARICRDVVILVRDDGSGLDAERKKDASEALDRLITRAGYCRSCASDAASMLVRKRFQDLLV
jgi:predicted Ser/Thr protein kinase